MRNNSIMIIDDDYDDREFFCEALGKIEPNSKCISFELAEFALTYLSDEQNTIPDYIFLDINMPKINGMECLRKIKNMKHLDAVPVIMYTTSSLTTDIENAKNLGASGFLTKPTVFNKVCTELKKWIK